MGPICVIPARAGSKRVPGKNMRDLGGKPLVRWIAEACVKSDIFESIIVSTDSDEISEVAQSIDQVHVAPRPPELAADDVRAEQVFRHVISLIPDNERPEVACMAMPTAPFTRPEDLRSAYALMSKFEGCFLAVKTPFKTQRTFAVNSLGGVSPVGRWDDVWKQSQDLEETYQPTYGGMFIRTDHLLEFGQYYSPESQSIYEVEKWSGLDIDTLSDLAEAQSWLAAQMNPLQQTE